MYCVKCGTESNGVDKICSHCGCMISGETEKRTLSSEVKLIVAYFIGYMMVGVGALAIVASFIAIINGVDVTDQDALMSYVEKYAYQGQIFLDIIFLVIFILLGKKVLSFEQFKDKKISKIILVTLGCGVAFLACNMIMSNLFGLIPGADESANQQALEDMINIAPLTVVFAAVFFAPIVEELVFRGGIYKLLENKWSSKVAILGSGAIFGLLHVVMGLLAGDLYELIYFINYFAMGCAFGFLYYKTKNIYICIGVHFLNNLVGVLLMFLQQ